jgi:hypothetical protein
MRIVTDFYDKTIVLALTSGLLICLYVLIVVMKALAVHRRDSDIGVTEKAP